MKLFNSKPKFIHISRINFDCVTYKPQVNRKKQALMGTYLVTCLFTPFTNGTIPIVTWAINKYNPLWIYR